MRLKFLLVISVAYLGLISGILYMGLQREKTREEFWLRENSTLQLHSINDNIGLEIDKLKSEVIKVATAMEANQKEDAVKALGQFVGVAALGFESDSFLWQIDETKPDIWSGPWISRAKEISESENQPRFFAVQTQDENLGSIIRSAVFFKAKIKDKNSAIKKTVRLVGILAQPLFQNVLASQQSAGMQFFIFNQKGLAIAHTISDYVGNSLSGDKLYEEIKKTKLVLGNFSHKDFKGDPVVSMYERIEHTDLTVVAQIRPAQLLAIDWVYYGQNFLTIFGIFCLLSGAMFFIIPREFGKTQHIVVEKIVEKIIEKPVEKSVEKPAEKFIEKSAESIIESIIEKSALTPTDRSVILGSVPSIPAHLYEKLEVSAQKLPSSVTPFSTSSLPTKMSILAKVISQVKAPFLSILGHVQIAKTHPHGGSFQAIENEARSAREILDRLAQYSGSGQAPHITVPLIDLIDAALRSLEGPILRGAIKINKKVSEEIAIKCDPDDFKMALTSIFRNAIESMERVLKKELNVEAVKKSRNQFELCISDTGEGILPHNMVYLFEPFFSTKSPLDHKGLGLAAVQGIIQTHLGDVAIVSDIDRGTTVKISMPSSIEASVRLAEIQMQNRPAWMELIKTPSKEELVMNESLLEPIEIKKPETIYHKIEESEVSFELKEFEFTASSKERAESFDKPESFDKEASLDSDKTRPKSFEMPEASLLFASPVKRLKKKSEPLDKLKVQIPRPEEKL